MDISDNPIRSWGWILTVLDWKSQGEEPPEEEALTKRERDDDAEEMQDILEETFLQSEGGGTED